MAASTQNQALNALLFLYNEVLEKPLPNIESIRAKDLKRLPVVLTRSEVAAVLKPLSGVPLLIVQLLYGGGLRVNECLRLRVKDVDFGQEHLIIRDGKGHKDRTTTLPQATLAGLKAHLVEVKAQHHRDLQQGHGCVDLPYALARKYPNANKEWGWQYLFPSQSLSKNPQADDGILYRHHLHTSSVQKAVKQAAKKVGIAKHVTPRYPHRTPPHKPTSVPHPCATAFSSAMRPEMASCAALPTDLKKVSCSGLVRPGLRPAAISPISA